MAAVFAHLRLTLGVWAALIVADFVLNAVVFAGIYREGGPFFLSLDDAFRRIPLGYLSFLILAGAVVELVVRLGIRELGPALRLGLAGGTALGAAWSLGLYSIATVSIIAALAFAAIYLVLFTVAAIVAAWGLRERTGRR